MFDYEKNHMHEYFFRRLCELSDEEDNIIRAIRTKKGLIILADKLREIDTERRILTNIYEQLKFML